MDRAWGSPVGAAAHAGYPPKPNGKAGPSHPQLAFLRGLVARGVSGVKLVVSDCHLYLLDYVHKKRGEGCDLSVVVERASGADRPWHLRLLCCLEIIPRRASAEP